MLVGFKRKLRKLVYPSIGLKAIVKILSLYILLSSSCVHAQQTSASDHKSTARSFHYTYDNDMFSGTDRYYTQGSTVELRHPMFRRSPLSKVLLYLSGRQTEHAISFKQDVFTPRSIRNEFLDTTDRPYAGSFFFSQKAISTNDRSKLTSSVDIGCIGPVALGEEMQKFIHRYGGNVAPLGWENQVANSFIANYNVCWESAFFSSKWFDIIGELGGKAGALYTNGSGGLMIRAGKKNPYFAALDQKSPPAWELYTTLNGTATYVLHNAMLQGVPWTKSKHVFTKTQIERWVYKLDAGLTFSIKNISLSYTQSFITPEFKGGWHHSWGGGNIVYRF
jgi:lipid A 3-O-deacylase